MLPLTLGLQFEIPYENDKHFKNFYHEVQAPPVSMNISSQSKVNNNIQANINININHFPNKKILDVKPHSTKHSLNEQMFASSKAHKVKDFITYLEKNYKIAPTTQSVDKKSQ